MLPKKAMNTQALIRTLPDNDSLLLLFITFLKIGSTAFGGFMALISVVQSYVVDRRKLISQSDMLDGISLATILPGPVAVNVVAYVGYRIRGIPGAITCVLAVMLPSFILILVLSYAYFTWGDMPALNRIFSGFLPAVAAIIVSAAFNMGKKAIIGVRELIVAFVSAVALIVVGGFYCTIAIIVVSGLVGYVFLNKLDEAKLKIESSKQKTHIISSKSLMISICILLPLAYVLSVNIDIIEIKLLSVFSGMSLLLFGGGFVFIPMIQETIVENYAWLTHKEFVDGIALGQVTPGPILISATFIGYKVAGFTGATLATLGIFIPPAVVMVICSHYLQMLKASSIINAVLNGVRCGVIGMIAAAAFVVIQSAESNIISLIIFLAALLALIKFKLEVAWIIPVAGLTGYFLY